GHVRGGERELRAREAVVSRDVLQDIAECAKLLFPIADGPCGAVEMSDAVRGDFVSAAIKRVHVLDAPANLLRRSAETDAGITAPLMRAFVDAPAGIGDEIAAAEKKGKVNAISISVQLGSEIAELLPAL